MISIRNLTKRYDRAPILENLNLDIAKGEAIVIVGGSGCGKSTLLRCINALEPITSGQVLIEGTDIHAKGANVQAIRRKLGMVYQNFNLFSHLNVMENMILAPMKVAGMSQQDAISKAEKLLDQVGLRGKAYHMPDSLSGGQKQRVAIARALMMEPDIMLFDEPTSALDPTMVDEVESVIRQLIQSGITSVIVTHEMRFARNIASRIVFLAERGVYESASPKEFFENPERDLTRQFIYRSRLLERDLTPHQADIYALCSECKAFATPYGFSFRQQRGMEYLCDELILPLLHADDTGHPITLRFVASENDDPHTVLVEFSDIKSDPLKHPALDELNLLLLRGFTTSLESTQNSDGIWEVRALL